MKSMKRLILEVLILTFIPQVFAEQTVLSSEINDVILTDAGTITREKSYNPDAKTNPISSSNFIHFGEGRALGDILMTIDLDSLGMPHDGYDNAGLTWDGTYLYLLNMYDNHVYAIDPTVPSIDTCWPAESTLSWGLGHEDNLWITEGMFIPGMTYEYTFGGSATGNSFNAIQNGARWMADASEWWADGEIWILAVGGTNKAYKFSLPTGSCIDSIGDPAWTYISQRGLTYDPFSNTFWLGGWNTDMIYEVDPSTGEVLRSFSFPEVAGLAYDWQSFLYPEPVLWVATNTATNYIHMVDISNTQVAFWKTYAPMPDSIYFHSAVYSDVTGAPTVYTLGGNSSNTHAIYEFDVSTESWSTSIAALNHDTGRNASAVVKGKIYCMGGADVTGSTVNYNQEFDPVSGTVTDKTPLPTARHFLGALAWRDTLIYTIGGQGETDYYDVVEIYDPANDAWMTGTALPIANRSFACGISGDTIYLAGGYNVSTYVSATYIGIIDPANPTSITWNTGPDIPTGLSGNPGRSRVQGACVDGKFYFTCGDDHGMADHGTWYYDPSDIIWHQTLDKTTPISNTQCAVFVPTLDGGTFFCPGGYNTATGHETNVTEGLVNVGLAGVNGYSRKETKHYLSVPMSIVKNEVLFTYNGDIPRNIIVIDITGRIVKEYNNVRPGTTLHFGGDDFSQGIYFISVKGSRSSAKVTLLR